MGFYNLPDGSFYDPDGYLFDKYGFDEFGGSYNENNIYIPGEKNKNLIKKNNNPKDNKYIKKENNQNNKGDKNNKKVGNYYKEGEDDYYDYEDEVDPFENDELLKQFESDIKASDNKKYKKNNKFGDDY